MLECSHQNEETDIRDTSPLFLLFREYGPSFKGMVFRSFWSENGNTFCLRSLEKGTVVAEAVDKKLFLKIKFANKQVRTMLQPLRFEGGGGSC